MNYGWRFMTLYRKQGLRPFPRKTYAKKQNTDNIDGLFQQYKISGEYFYNSRKNHAYYSNNKFSVYDQIITPNFILYPFGNFLPFNSITNLDNTTQVSKINSVGTYMQNIINRLVYDYSVSDDDTRQQLIDMLAEYRASLRNTASGSSTAWANWDSAQAMEDFFNGDGDGPTESINFSRSDDLLKKMYAIDYDVAKNFFFGMEMKMNFIQPKDGYTGNDTNGDGAPDYPMTFTFSGDDDVWVYIDDVLFLDLTGIHRHVGGKIDFVEGKVYYYALDTEGTGDVSETPYAEYTFEEMLEAAGVSTDSLNSKGTFADYTTHKFNFYYTERGSGSSVCRMNFNFPILRENSISVFKELTSDEEEKIALLGNPDFRFQILAPDNDNDNSNDKLFIGAGVTYSVYDSKGTLIDDKRITGDNGVFVLKAGQRAEFSGIAENSEQFLVGGEKIYDLLQLKKFVVNVANRIDELKEERNRVCDLVNYSRDGKNAERVTDFIIKTANLQR